MSGVVFDFEGGFDFGWGGFFAFNGNTVYVVRSDVWWGGSDWNNGAVWRISDLVANVGMNTVEIMGSEGCCDGA